MANTRNARPSLINTAKQEQGAFDNATLKQYFKDAELLDKMRNDKNFATSKKEQIRLNKLLKALDKEREDEKAKYEQALISKAEELRKAGLTMTNSQRAQFEQVYAEQQKKKDQDTLKAHWDAVEQYYKRYLSNADALDKKEEERQKKRINLYEHLAELKNPFKEEKDADDNVTQVKKTNKERLSEAGVNPKDWINSLKTGLKDLGPNIAKSTQAAVDKTKSGLNFVKNLATGNDGGEARQTVADKATDVAVKMSMDAQANMQNIKDGFTKSMDGLGQKFVDAIADMSNVINSTIEQYADYKGEIDARLQGSDKTFSSITKKMQTIAFSGLMSASTLYDNVQALAEEGIVTNLEQRAMLMTMSDVVASTFEVNNKSLKQIIRIQQEDSTAARLGMEAYLTRFLNEFVENTEYLTDTFDSVADSLLTASSLMSSAAESTEFEYVVQKWLGTLSGVGLSESAATAIAEAIGNLGSGNIDALNSSDTQNLLVMAASKAGLSYAEMLTNGLTATDTNKLLEGIVEYMRELGASASNVVKSQLADTFGVSISDLKAVANLTESEIETVYNNTMSYNDMYSELSSQFSQLTDRLGAAKILENLFSNYEYSTGMSIANSPALYALWKTTDLIQSVTGGINIPAISVMGNMIDLETTVENLMKTGIIGVSTLANIGNIISGVSSTLNGSTLLSVLGVAEGTTAVTRGSGLSDYNGSKLTARTSGTTTSGSTYVGNSDSDSYYSSSINAATDSAQETASNTEDNTVDPVVEYFNDIQLKSDLETICEDISSIKSALYNDDGVGVHVKNFEELSDITIGGFSDLALSNLSGLFNANTTSIGEK